MKNALVAAAAAASLLAFAAVGLAITNGGPDGNGHPEVGALLAPHAYSDGTWEACTGTLISPTVFLTAAHCDLGVSRVAVTFDSSYDSTTGKTYWGTWHADPQFNQAQSDPHDVAVVVLDKAVKGITPARLPDARPARFAQGRRRHHRGWLRRSVGDDGRRRSELPLRRHPLCRDRLRQRDERDWIRASMNPSTGDGGTCYGDSGGPNFLGAGAGETNIVAGTTITGDFVCRATNVDYRMDTPSARAFLAAYVTLP